MLELEKILETVDFINSATGSFRPEVGIVLGSGLGGLTKDIDIQHSIKYEDIPNFPVSTVKGHEGNLVFGTPAAGKRSSCKAASIITKATVLRPSHSQ